VEAERDRFAVETPGITPAPLSPFQEPHVLDQPLVDHRAAAVEAGGQRLAVEHVLVFRLLDRRGRRTGPQQIEQAAEEHEVESGRAPGHGFFPGRYQTGEVQARSCSMRGISALSGLAFGPGTMLQQMANVPCWSCGYLASRALQVSGWNGSRPARLQVQELQRQVGFSSTRA